MGWTIQPIERDSNPQYQVNAEGYLLAESQRKIWNVSRCQWHSWKVQQRTQSWGELHMLRAAEIQTSKRKAKQRKAELLLHHNDKTFQKLFWFFFNLTKSHFRNLQHFCLSSQMKLECTCSQFEALLFIFCQLQNN